MRARALESETREVALHVVTSALYVFWLPWMATMSEHLWWQFDCLHRILMSLPNQCCDLLLKPYLAPSKPIVDLAERE